MPERANVDGQTRLARGIDAGKDQSYALFNLARANLSRVLLPLGEYRKSQVRELAARMDLPVRDKAESQEICFVGDNDYARLVAERMPELCKTGDVVDTQGKKLGQHSGIYQFTIGQRRGLNIACGEPMYVIRLERDANRVVLGTKAQTMQSKLWADNVNWLVDSPPAEPFPAVVQIRYNHRGAPGTVTPMKPADGNTHLRVDFQSAVSAITPGQAAVFYDDDQNVIGGGWIYRSET